MDAKKQETTVKTMGDMIRQSSDPELADIILAFVLDTPACQNKAECTQLLEIQKEIPDSMCKRCIMYWLGSEVVK